MAHHMKPFTGVRTSFVTRWRRQECSLQWRACNRNRWHVERVHAVIEEDRTVMYTVTAEQAGISAANSTRSYWSGFQESLMISVDTVGRCTLSVIVQEGRSSPFSLFESIWVVDVLIWQKIETWKCRKYCPDFVAERICKKVYISLWKWRISCFFSLSLEGLCWTTQFHLDVQALAYMLTATHRNIHKSRTLLTGRMTNWSDIDN
jgi:hypothetical protein